MKRRAFGETLRRILDNYVGDDAFNKSQREQRIMQLMTEQRLDNRKDRNSRPAPRQWRDRSRYMPHQGRKECARRARS